MKNYRAVIYDSDNKIVAVAFVGYYLKDIYKAARAEVKKRKTSCEIFSNGKLICAINNI